MLKSTKVFKSIKSKKTSVTRDNAGQTKKVNSFLMANRTEILRQKIQNKRYEGGNGKLVEAVQCVACGQGEVDQVQE